MDPSPNVVAELGIDEVFAGGVNDAPALVRAGAEDGTTSASAAG